MNPLKKLEELFISFPGIGPRQAKRFVQFLLHKDQKYILNLVSEIQNLKKLVSQCPKCKRFFSNDEQRRKECTVCENKSRDPKLLVVPRDMDLEHLERLGVYRGYYFVLGGTVPILDKEPEKRIRIEDLIKRITSLKSENPEFSEVILAMNANPEGENTSMFIESSLKSLAKDKNITITALGRGLSTGSELEYSDAETMKQALAHRVHV